MSSNFDCHKNRSRSPSDDYARRSLLAKVDKSELIKLKVSIKRSGLETKGPSGPLERDIDDYIKICAYVHVRKVNSKPPRIPLFGKDIKVNQDFTEDRTVFTHEKRPSRRSKSRSRSRSARYRSRSKDRSRNDSRRSRSRDRSKNDSRRSKSRDRTRSRSRSRDRSKRSRERTKRSTSRTRRSSSRYRSRSRERRHSPNKRKHRDDSREKPRRSRSRPLSPVRHDTRDRHRRAVTPLKPGEYRPGHPDLSLKKSPRSSSRGDKNVLSTSRDRRSPGKYTGSSRSRRTPSPHSRDRRRDRSPPVHMPMPGMDYGYYPPAFGPPMVMPYRGRFPMVMPPNYPRYPPNGFLPIMPRMPMMRPNRWPVYNSGVCDPMAPKPATITSKDDKEELVIEEQPSTDPDHNEAVSSSNKHEDSAIVELNA